MHPGATQHFGHAAVHIPCPLQVTRDFLPQRRQSPRCAIAVAPCGDCASHGIDDGSGRVKIGLAQLEMYNRAPFPFKFLRPRKDRQGAFAGQFGNARRDSSRHIRPESITSHAGTLPLGVRPTWVYANSESVAQRELDQSVPTVDRAGQHDGIRGAGASSEGWCALRLLSRGNVGLTPLRPRANMG